MLRFLPGGPFDEEAVQNPLTADLLAQYYGLDQPLSRQYSLYIKSLLSGDLGRSLIHRDLSVFEVLARGLPVSITLGGFALILVLLVGGLLGGWAGYRPQSLFSRGLYQWATLSVCIPSFVSAPLLILFLSFGWPWTHFWPQLSSWQVWLPSGLWLTPRHAILPVIALAYRPSAFLLRLVRASVLETQQCGYVQSARAKGVPPSQVFLGHILQNAISPTLSYLGPLAASLLTGSFVIEIAFAIPGVSSLFVHSVFERDYPVVLGATLVFSILLVLSHLMVDGFRHWFLGRIANEA